MEIIAATAGKDITSAKVSTISLVYILSQGDYQKDVEMVLTVNLNTQR
jgi:hypothetical protein